MRRHSPSGLARPLSCSDVLGDRAPHVIRSEDLVNARSLKHIPGPVDDPDEMDVDPVSIQVPDQLRQCVGTGGVELVGGFQSVLATVPIRRRIPQVGLAGRVSFG